LGRRRRYLPWVVCATLAAAGVPALALGQADPPSSASVVVSDTGFAPGTVDILVGGKVNFSYPSGNGVYNVVWDRGSLEPATCEQTQGVVWGYGTTLPWWMQAAPWIVEGPRSARASGPGRSHERPDRVAPDRGVGGAPPGSHGA